jgi:hypothetical protein
LILVVEPFQEFDLTALLPMVEGKSLSSMKSTDEVRQAMIDLGFRLNQDDWKSGRKIQTTKSSQGFKDLYDRLTGAVKRYSGALNDKSMSTYRVRLAVGALLRDAYSNAYKLGIRGSGPGLERPLSKEDELFIASAYREEMKYFNAFMKDVRTGDYNGDLQRRLQAYVETLKHIYYAGRVMGTPYGWVIDWISPLDRATCGGCRFLSSKSPYTRETIPCTPRSGQTVCLNNCRCRLLMRQVTDVQYEAVNQKHRSKQWYTKELLRIKTYRLKSR